MTSLATSAAATALYDCAKCDGKGNIGAFAHVHGGACFPCGGSGKVALKPIAEDEKLQITICNIGRSVSRALESLQGGDRARAEYLLETILADLFTIGSDNAREILADIAKGEWFNGAEMTEGRADLSEAADLRLWVIARGRAMEAA